MYRPSLWSPIPVVVPWILAAALCPATGCKHSSPAPAVDLRLFQEMAAHSPCASVRNQLFLIDGSLVFWSRAGNCPDANYADVLYAGTVDRVLCEDRDSIAGPARTCHDPAYREMFDIITANRDQPDLGLGPEHTVAVVPI